MNTTAKRTLGVLGATAVGAVAGILFAPAKGKDTRAKLRTQAKNAQSKTKETMNQLSEKAKSKYNTISNQISEKVNKPNFRKSKSKQRADFIFCKERD